MASSAPISIPRSELFGRLQKLMFLRVLFVSLLLGASIFVEVEETKTAFGDIQTYHYLLIAAIYCITVLYVILLKRLNDLIRFAYLQLLVDTALVTAIIYATGGIESIFSFLYILTIINGSIILYRKGGMIAASSCSILYGLLIDLHYYRVIEPLGSRLTYPADYQSSYIFYMILVNIAAFYLVAFLSSYPSEQARRSRNELIAKQEDIVKLEALNEWIIRSMTSGLITLDDQERILLFNPAAEALFGIPTEACTGKGLMEALPFLKGHFGMAEEEGSSHGSKRQNFIDLPYLRPNGEKIFLRGSVSPLRLPGGEPGGQILFFQDMTKMREIEEEMKRVEGLAMIFPRALRPRLRASSQPAERPEKAHARPKPASGVTAPRSTVIVTGPFGQAQPTALRSVQRHGPVVRTPSVHMLSLISAGTPVSGVALPFFSRSSAAFACCRAWS